jgi:phosphocarrier protein
MTQIRRHVTIINKLGLHARAAARFVQTASRYECDISVIKGGKEVNGKSILGVMMLAAGRGTEIEIVTSGRQADEAARTLESLVAERFGESE